ncbi:unnamed protein product [Choristocarpus tenellus]
MWKTILLLSYGISSAWCLYLPTHFSTFHRKSFAFCSTTTHPDGRHQRRRASPHCRLNNISQTVRGTIGLLSMSAQAPGSNADDDSSDREQENTPPPNSNSDQQDGKLERIDGDLDLEAMERKYGLTPNEIEELEELKSIDWDLEFRMKRLEMEEKERKVNREAKAFSGRREVIATKNAKGEYDIVTIPSPIGGKRGRADDDEGFGFADEGRDGDARSRMLERERQAVDLVTTNKVYAGMFAVLLATLCFYLYVFATGGITDGSERFRGIPQPTVS